jgi:hypothetical protein
LPRNYWYWVDLSEAEPLRKSSALDRVDSEATLGHLLREHARRLPHDVLLTSPSGAMMFIALGGLLVAVHFYPDEEAALGLTAVAQEVLTDRSHCFTSDGLPLAVEPPRLLPVESVIQAALHFYRTQELPPHLQWAER